MMTEASLTDLGEWMHEGRLAILERAERLAVEQRRADELDAILTLRRLVLLDYVSSNPVILPSPTTDISD